MPGCRLGLAERHDHHRRKSGEKQHRCPDDSVGDSLKRPRPRGPVPDRRPVDDGAPPERTAEEIKDAAHWRYGHESHPRLSNEMLEGVVGVTEKVVGFLVEGITKEGDAHVELAAWLQDPRHFSQDDCRLPY